ncbi:MAG: hypothetical protein ACR2PX_05450 [Endozoicomonas sp.]|uniref:hypothetical protein n=1 Tax=Endozoicomonas sp. TaxID=1892382 RepID=UPI003D9BC9B9
MKSQPYLQRFFFVRLSLEGFQVIVDGPEPCPATLLGHGLLIINRMDFGQPPFCMNPCTGCA